MGQILLLILICIFLIGFFAGTEIAFASVNKLNIELKKKQGHFTSKILGRFVENPSELLGSSLLGINLVLVIYGLQMTKLIDHFLVFLPKPLNSEWLTLGIDTLFATLIILLFVEFLPKTLFRSKSEQILSFVAVPMYVASWVLSPIMNWFVSLAAFMLKYLFNVNIKEQKNIFHRVNIDQFIKQSLHGHENENNEVNKELFDNALQLVNTKVRKFMIPRNEIVSVEIGTSILQVKELFIETKLSKIIVYDKNLDNISGYVHHFDCNKKPKTIEEIIHQIPVVPEAMNAVELINLFTKERKSVAWVIDEFGGTAGIVTMEDILEEIFGDIYDEYDKDKYVEKQISEQEYIFSGRLELNYLNVKYDLNFKNDEVETLSGYIVKYHEKIPKIKEKIIIDMYEFDILLVNDTKIETIKLKVLKPF